VARVFLSHSSRDNEAAARMKAWLEAQHFEVTFLDFDKHAGPLPCAEWEYPFRGRDGSARTMTPLNP
jgi:hypothetical protein